MSDEERTAMNLAMNIFIRSDRKFATHKHSCCVGFLEGWASKHMYEAAKEDTERRSLPEIMLKPNQNGMESK